MAETSLLDRLNDLEAKFKEITTLITDPAVMTRELAHRREHYNTIRLHEGIGYVTPDDEHHGRGPAIRKARDHGLKRARANRIATHRQLRHTTHTETPADVVN